MSNFAKVTIVFTAPTDGQGFFIKINFGGVLPLPLEWISETTRTTEFQYTISTSINGQTTEAFNAIAADVANSIVSGGITVTQTAFDTIEVEANAFGWTIVDGGTDTETRAVLTETPEVLPAKDFQLTGLTYSDAVSNVCSNIHLNITQNGDGVAPFIWISPATGATTLDSDVARQAATTFLTAIIQDNETDQAQLSNIIIPPIFTTAFINDISVVANAGGLDATVTVFMDTPTFSLFNYTFSLSGSNFQASNVFTGVVDGTYTLFVNDGFGCIINTQFDVDVSQSIQRNDPIGIVPFANSMRMVKSEVTRFNNLENTLYQDEFEWNETRHGYKQLYQTNDGVIPTQFRSNYDTISAKIQEITIVDGVCVTTDVQTLINSQKSDNIDSRDTRDCITFNVGNNQTGIYFTEGNTYDPGTTDISGTYSLLGTLPDWGVVGNTVILSVGVTGSFLIKQVTFDSDVQAEVLIIDNIWTSGNQSEASIADVTYDRLPYEVFEFNVDTSSLPSGVYSNQLIMSDSLAERPTLIFNSERYKIAVTHKRTIWIDYSDSPGTGIDYETGYIGHIRVRGKTPEAKYNPAGEVVASRDSGGNIKKQKDSPTFTGELYTEAQPRYMVEKLRLIFAHKSYFVNELEWQNEEEMQVDDTTDSSLSNITIVLQRVGYEAYKTDNIIIDGPIGTIDQETGPLLQ